MTKARLIKRHEIKERDAQQEPVTEEKKNTKERAGVVDWTKRKKGPDPRKAFADLFVQPQTQTQ